MTDIEYSIGRAKRGDPAAFSEVAHEFQAPLRSFIAAYCPATDQIDEVAQRTFVWAYQHLNEYQAGTRFYSWLKAVARNILLSELEVQKREAQMRRKYLQHLQATSMERQLSAADPETAPDLRDALRECLDRLPEHSQTLLRRRYEAQESIKELALELGREVNAVKVALFRIRQALRRCVERRQETSPVPGESM